MLRKQLSLTAIVASMLFVLVAPTVHADVNDFTINTLDADYTLGLDDPQGTLTVREQFTVEFTDYNHGLLRALPKKYNGSPLHLHVNAVSRDGAKESYTKYTGDGNTVLKIGDPGTTITGLHHYEINYKVTNVMRILSDGKAELDWNVNGTQWNQPFLHVSARLHVPDSLSGKLTGKRCFTGSNGSTASDCLVVPGDKDTTFTTSQKLSPGQTLTFNAVVPAGYFAKPSFADRLHDYGLSLIAVALPPLAALQIASSAWRKKGRDAKGRGTIVPEYSPPADLKPAEIDVLLHNKVGKNAVSATIIDLAIRKFLRIIESENNGVLGIGKRKDYSFVRLTPPAADVLNGYESIIMDGIFLNGDRAEVSKLRVPFAYSLSTVQKTIPESLAKRGFFAGNPTTAGFKWILSGLAFIFVGIVVLTHDRAPLAIGVFAASAILLVFGFLMPKRTPLGAAAKDSAEGLKLYLNTAEKDRIAMLQSPDAAYAPKTTEPAKTVDLFEKLLPYAMVLGVEQKWAEQFEQIYVTPPDWYGGSWSTFNSMQFTNSLSASMHSMNSSFAAPASSGSGSGGSAGGGGGGGGGGGW